MKYQACILSVLLVLLGSVSIPAEDTNEPSIKADAVVALDGSGKFKSIQEAILASPRAFSAENPWVIYVKPGIYKELVYIQRERGCIRLVGSDPEKTVITYNLYSKMIGLDGKEITTHRTPTVDVDGDHFQAENITFENSAGAVGQAVAVRVNGDRVVFRNCRFIGWQDTLFLNRGRQYLTNCYICGQVDFIFGGATTYFDHCHIHALTNGYLTAASTPVEQRYGFVLSNCSLTGATGAQTYLGRPWRPFANTIYLNCNIADAVRPEGWNNWGKADNEKTVRYGEYQSSGSGAPTTNRVTWAKQLTAAEAADYAKSKVLAGTDGWNP